MKRPEEARVQIERALELDPLNSLFQALYGLHLMWEGRYDDAIVQYRNALRTAPNLQTAFWGLWHASHAKRMYEEALAAAKAHFADDPEAEEALARGYAAGGYPEAMRLTAETLAALSRTTHVQPTDIASLYAYAGNSDRALEWLEKAHEERDPVLVGLSVGQPARRPALSGFAAANGPAGKG